MSQESYLSPTVSVHCFSIFMLPSFSVSPLMTQALTEFFSFLLLDWSFSLISTYLENETSKAALKLRSIVVTTK